MKFISCLKACCAMLLLSVFASNATAQGWPSNYEGVMLQGFYWDSYNDTKWTTLESQADELSKYFDIIWIPNSGFAGGYNNMGYMPQYWFTNHNSSFGSEAELLSMIKTFKDKGTGFIADVVINHRNGVSSWCDFPTENWNGKDWKIGLDGICRNDEAAYNGYNCTGNYDTGDNFDGCRDLDHTNANVQNNCKNYCKCLLEKYGYVGFRLDMVKGYGPEYTKIYNQYSHPTFCVGEYWDSNYDTLKWWIDTTGKTSAVFDFPCKYQLNKAMNYGEYLNELVWKANGTTDQPAGMIHFAYQQYAVTFVDNHDTYRDGSKFTGNVLAANAFILCSPGTPCVFLPHYQQHKSAIQQMILARKNAGISNTSSVKVLKAESNCYMAEITGSKGKLVVKIGCAMVSPSGYSDSQIVTSGNNYCIWSTVSGDNTSVAMPSSLYILGNLSTGHWSPAKGVSMTKGSKEFTAENVEFVPEGTNEKCYFNLTTKLAANWETLNGSATRYGAKFKNTALADGASAAFINGGSDPNSWEIDPGVYTVTADFESMTVMVKRTGDVNDNNGGDNGDDNGDDNNNDDNNTDRSAKRVVFYDNANTAWSAPYIYVWDSSKKSTFKSWPGYEMTKYVGNIYMYEVPEGADCMIFNNNNQGRQSDDITSINFHHAYQLPSFSGNGKKTADDKGLYHPGVPAKLYIMGHVDEDTDNHWNSQFGIPLKKDGTKFSAEQITFYAPVARAAEANASFSFSSALDTSSSQSWAGVNGSHRFGAKEKNVSADESSAHVVKIFAPEVNAASAYSWTIPTGTYNISLDFSSYEPTMVITKVDSSGVEAVEISDPDSETIYYDLTGRRVAHPSKGIYIIIENGQPRKAIVR